MLGKDLVLVLAPVVSTEPITLTAVQTTGGKFGGLVTENVSGTGTRTNPGPGLFWSK